MNKLNPIIDRRKARADAITKILREAAAITGCKSPKDAYHGAKYATAITCRQVAVALCAERLGLSDINLAEAFQFSRAEYAKRARFKGEKFIKKATLNLWKETQ